MVMFVVLANGFSLKDARAATGQLYLSPGNTSAQAGGTVTLNVRINPGTNTDTVTVNVGYDPTKLQYVSIDYAGSPYNTQLGFSSTGSSVSFSSTELSGTPVSTDSFVAQLDFTALAGSGSSALGLSGNAAYAGTPTNPTVVGGAVDFTSPPPATCPAGQTGAPPNCTVIAGSGAVSSGLSPSQGSPANVSPVGHGSPNKTVPPNPTPVSSPVVPAAVINKNVQYSIAAFTVASSAPEKVYLRFGLNGQLTTNTSLSDLGTSHVVAIDPSLLVPGETYTYVVVSTNQQGFPFRVLLKPLPPVA